jgi:uncharacterized membrane protein YhhN
MAELTVQFLLLGLAAVFSVVYGIWYTRQPISLLRSVVKFAATFFLALAVAAYAGVGFLPLALLFCALGDWFLSRAGERSFLAGMGAFFAGHLLFIVVFTLGGASLALLLERWPILPLFTLFAVLMLRLLWPKLGALRGPVSAYILVIVAMGLAAASLPITAGGMVLALGAASFILSDSILSFELFLLGKSAPARHVTPFLVWLFYWGGLVAISAGATGVV